MEEYITPKTEAISIIEYRNLLETTNTIGRFLSNEEFQSIMRVYLSAADRLEKEGNES